MNKLLTDVVTLSLGITIGQVISTMFLQLVNTFTKLLSHKDDEAGKEVSVDVKAEE